MASAREHSKTLYLSLLPSGNIALDKDYRGISDDAPSLDPDIILAPVTIHQLTQAAANTIIDLPDKDDPKELERLLESLETCVGLLKSALKRRDETP